MQPEAVRMPKKSSEVEEDLAKMEKEICKESKEFSGEISLFKFPVTNYCVVKWICSQII